MNKLWGYSVTGVSDDLFLRGNVPMTREEVRVITLSKARLGPGMTVWDVGSGSGSISVEAAMKVTGGTVYAVERLAEGCRLTSDNATRFGLKNVIIVRGEAPEALTGLPRPHRVIVGGSGGKLEVILEKVKQLILPAGIMVINAVTLETLTAALGFLKAEWNTEVVQMSISKSEKIGNSHLMRGYNPVFVISAWERGGKDAG